jgi:AraC-like DNA-binding protein
MDMPLFMDLHKASDYDVKPTIEEIKRNHIADLKTQEKYGVRFIQYWINEEAGLVFCMMEGPDKESCIATHQEAHGDIPCNVIELKGGDYKVFMGNSRINKFDIAENNDGSLDTGYRSILAADIITVNNTIDRPYKVFKTTIETFGGREVNHSSEKIIAVFNSASQALDCAKAIQHEFTAHRKDKTELRIGMSSGEPVTDRDSIFGRTIQLANWLCDIASDGQISVATHTVELCKGMPSGNNEFIKVLSLSNEKFLNNFMMAIESVFDNEKISMEKLSKRVGLSQTQLYRKVTSLTGHSPNNFIHELRLKKALKLINQQYGNIAEIAFASGFNNPSYFTKSFQRRFGILPAKALKSS